MPATVSRAALNTLEMVSRMPATMPDMVELMPFHTFDAVVLTAPHMESHTACIADSTADMVELMALMAAPIAEVMASHTLEAVELTAPHTVSHTP